jgi:alanine or glycine:cation symporter, AGCS family
MNLYTKMIGILLLLNTVAMATPSSQICPEEPLPVAPTGGIDLLTYNIDQGFGGVVNVLESVLFFPIYQGTLPDCRGSFSLPLVLLLLGFGGLFFTIRFGFVNIKLFKHAIQVVQGKFDNPHDKGEISHFKALTSALSATVGLGNIAGVAVALAAGGPGAVFWMWIVAFLD